MPPKIKEVPSKKPPPPVIRPSISDSSLNYIPEDAVEGFEKRIETGISWTLPEEAARHHKQKCLNEHIAKLPFAEALQNKINKSILHGFLDENSTFSLQDQWEILLPMVIWDNERFSNEEGKICFRSDNSITDNLLEIIKRAVQQNDRDMLKRDLKMVNVLRINDSEMTELDSELKDFKNLTTLNLCGNYIAHVDSSVLPQGLQMLELQANRITTLDTFTEHLPNLIYLGLARNLLNDDSVIGLARVPTQLTVLDVSDNDICDLEAVLTPLSALQSLVALQLSGNPCSVRTVVCAGYARTTIMRLPHLRWLDKREVLPTDRSAEPLEPHPDDLRSAYFNFTVFRIMSVPLPPKPDKGAITAFHVELELPLLDSKRRNFLMFRNNESLRELLPGPEDEEWPSKHTPSLIESKMVVEPSSSLQEHDIYNHLTSVNSRELLHYRVFESNRVQWNKIMNFQEPTLRIFCPNLVALRDTFRTVVTVRLVYTVTTLGKQGKSDKKSALSLKPPGEQRLVLATIKCALKQPDWSQPSQHFHWDDLLGTDEAIHWGDGDLSVLQYTLAAVKTPKGRPDSEPGSAKQFPPENLTCHFGFGIDTLRA